MTGSEFISLLTKSPPVLITALGLSSLFILLELDTKISFIDASSLRKDYHHYLSIAVIFSFIYIPVFLFVKKWKNIEASISKFNENRFSNKLIKTDIQELSEQELHILSLYIYSNHKTIPFNVNLKPVRNLCRKNIIESRSLVPLTTGTMDFIISGFAWKYLNNNKSVFNIRGISEIEEEVKELKYVHSKYN